MGKHRVLVSMKDIQRYKVLQEVIEKRLKGIEAAEILKLTPIHISRLKARLLKEGLEGIIRELPTSPPNKKMTQAIEDEILSLRKELYYDFNILHFRDKLEEEHHIELCYESLRQILIKAHDHRPRRRRKIHRQRRRMPKVWMLVQMDSSQHQWLVAVPEKWWLIAMIDDATNEVPYARFFPQDTVFSNMQVLRRFIEMKGLFMSLYADRASHFKTTRHGGLHVEVGAEQADTQIERALEELGITLIPAHSPQAKGRIEVTFRLFQDRLIKEMRLARIGDYEEANRFLVDRFLPYYNSKWTHEAETTYMPLPKEKNLDLIFCIKEQRSVNQDNTVAFRGQKVQIPPSSIKLSFARTKVDVCLLEDHRIVVLYKNQVIAESVLPQDNKIAKKQRRIEKILNQREYIQNIIGLPKTLWIPPKNHLWRRFVDGNKCQESTSIS